MNGDLILYLIFLVGGIAIGYNLNSKNVVVKEEPESPDVQKLQQELIVYKNLKESLLSDVRYWRSKAEGK